MIWEYSCSSSPDEHGLAARASYAPVQFLSEIFVCQFCSNSMTTFSHSSKELYSNDKGSSDEEIEVLICPACGWWQIQHRQNRWTDEEQLAIEQDVEDMLMCRTPVYVFLRYETVGLAWGSLRKLDLPDVSVPMRELETYLTARFQDRFRIKPSSYEQIVASVFRDFGYYLRVIGRSGDGGIDIVLLDG
jgi:hypothetical protein